MERTQVSMTVARDETGAAGQRRVVIERLRPEIDAGRFPIKRTVGDAVSVTVDIFADGHDLLAGVLKHRRVPAASWTEIPLTPLGNDSWGASFTVTELGEYEYTVDGWIDRFGTWLKGLIAKAAAGQDVENELQEGAALVEESALQDLLRSDRPQSERVDAARDLRVRALMESHPDRRVAATYGRVLRVTVDPVRARFGSWYEMFPRSCTADPSRGATFRDAEARLVDIAAMGFDIVYLPPIHPIGRTHRKGRNN